MAKPTDVPEWALDDDFATGPAPVIGTPTKVDPGALSGQGFVPGTAAAAQIMNWLLNRGGSWFKWLDGLVDDDGTVAQVKRGMLQVLDSVRSDIIAGDADGVYARLRGEANLSHVVASAVEDEVYAALTSWLDTERARLSLRGTLREILGRDTAGDGAPISVPNGLNVGTSFTPPAGYLPGEPAFYTTAGSYTWTPPAGMRALLVEVVGAGGGAKGAGYSAVGGGGGEYITWFVTAGMPTPADPVQVEVGAGGISHTISPTNGGASIANFGGVSIVLAEGGKNDGSPGKTSSPWPGPKFFSGQYGGGVLSVAAVNGLRAVGGASGAGWAGAGGSAEVKGDNDFFYENGHDGAVKLTPYF